jgi:hypothetical protein
MWGFVHLRSTWGHVSMFGELNMEQVMDGYKTGPKNNCL